MEKTGQEQESLISEIQNGACARQEIYSRAWKIFVILVMLGLTSILNFFLKQFIQPSSLIFIYLVATIAGAIYFGIWAAVFSFIGGFLIFNFFFIEPFYTLHISSPQDLYNVGVYFVVAGLITYLINIVRRQNDFLKDRLDRVSLIEDMSREFLLLTPLNGPVAEKDFPELLRTKVLSQLGQLALRYARMILNVPGLVFFTEEDGSLKLWAKSSLDLETSKEDTAAAAWTLNHGEVSGAGTFNNLGSRYYFIPIKSHEYVIGVLGIRYDSRQLFPEQRRFLATISNLLSLVAARWVDLKYEQR
jgi:two-component system sensor histidine kinase KdpD